MTNPQNVQTDLTMVIPTKDRSDFLERLLFYYFLIGFRHKIIIADSSEKRHLIHNKDTIQKTHLKLNISHEIFDENLDPKVKIFQSLSHVETPYVVIGADDDFFVPKTLNLAIDFLESNPDYSTASGESLGFSLSSPSSHGKIINLGNFLQNSIEDEKSTDRLLKHLSNYAPNWYSVYRTNQLKKYWECIALFNFDVIFLELLPSCLSIIEGKSKKLDALYMVQQGGTQKSYVKIPSKIEWVSDPKWEPQYIRFRQSLSDMVIGTDHINENIAKQSVNKAFLLYCTPLLSKVCNNEKEKYWMKKQNRISVTIYSPIKTIFRYFKVRSQLSHLLNKIHIYKLSRKIPSFNSDLHPIIRAIECETNIFNKDQ